MHNCAVFAKHKWWFSDYAILRYVFKRRNAGFRSHKRRNRHKQLICRGLAKDGCNFVSFSFSDVCKGKKYIRCSLNYVWCNFFYIGHSFSHVLCSFRGVLKRTDDYGFAIIVGAYCIRPLLHRMKRNAKQRHNIAKPRNSGRMQYAPTKAQFVY